MTTTLDTLMFIPFFTYSTLCNTYLLLICDQIFRDPSHEFACPCTSPPVPNITKIDNQGFDNLDAVQAK